MDQDTLVDEQIKAGNRFLIEFQKYCPVQAAFWLKEEDQNYWFLYAASDQITDENFDVAYGEVARIAHKRHDPWFDPFRVKVIGADEPLAKAVIELLQHYPIQTPTRFPGRMLGGIAADDLYVYPASLPVTS